VTCAQPSFVPHQEVRSCPWSWLFAFAVWVLPPCAAVAAGTPAAGGLDLPQGGLVQSAVLDPSKPLFVPTHARVTTTLRFPGPIGAPEGRGFTEDETRVPGEYLVTWTRGEAHLTVTPLDKAGALNLNISYQGSTYVVYFYPVERQFQALACLNLNPLVRASSEAGFARADVLSGEAVGCEPAHLFGLVDKLKLLRVLAPGAAAQGMAEGMGLEIVYGPAPDRFWAPEVFRGYTLQLTHVVREKKGRGLAFCLRINNRRPEALALDVSSFGVRCGDVYLPQVLCDAPVILAPGEECEAFLCALSPSLQPLVAGNDWHVSVGVIGAVSASEDGKIPVPDLSGATSGLDHPKGSKTERIPSGTMGGEAP